jgi:hypothetical protein
MYSTLLLKTQLKDELPSLLEAYPCFVYPDHRGWRAVVPESDAIDFAQTISRRIQGPVFFTEMDNGSEWSFVLYDGGNQISSFLCMRSGEIVEIDNSLLNLNVLASYYRDKDPYDNVRTSLEADEAKMPMLSPGRRLHLWRWLDDDWRALWKLLTDPKSWQQLRADELPDIYFTRAFDVGELDDMCFDKMEEILQSNALAFQILFPGVQRLGPTAEYKTTSA